MGIRLIVAITFALTVLGCGRANDRVAVYPTSGKVLVRGAPAEGAKVVLYSVDRQDAKIPFPTGVVKPDGTFELTSYTEGDGAPAGTYKATIIWPEPIPAGVNSEVYSPADRLRGRYSEVGQSKLEVTVAEGENSLTPFELK